MDPEARRNQYLSMFVGEKHATARPGSNIGVSVQDMD